jgi:hypothetical protein
VIVRLLIWSLYDSQTTIDELRQGIAALTPPSTWMWNEATERFGMVAFGDELPEVVGWARDLIGDDAEVYEEFDAIEV